MKKTFAFAAALVMTGAVLISCGAPSARTAVGPGEGPVSFETGYYGFTARSAGNAGVERVGGVSKTGNYSLLVTGRNRSWNGIALDVSAVAVPFEDHEFSLWVRPADGAGAVTFQLSAEFAVQGRTVWRHFGGALASVTAPPGVWTEMRGTRAFYAFDTVTVYIETDAAGAFAGFYIDDVVFRRVVEDFVVQDLPSLSEVYADYFLFGTAVLPRDMRGPRFDFVRRHFNAITAGNDMKPEYLQPLPGVFTFDVADGIVQTALDHGMTMIGHTLVWHTQSPDWMNYPGISRERAIENLVNHVTEVVGRYRGRVHSWDVVNEAFPSSVSGNPADWRANLRRTPWLEAIGYEYIEIAFRAAHAADPDALLYYNDYNLNHPGKREAVFHMVRELRERGVPIHGIGMQGHYSLSTLPRQVEDSIRRFSELGVKISITELDITVDHAQGWDRLTESAERMQAILFARLFLIFRAHSDVIERVTLWGLDDATSWRADRFPLPFNRDLSAKAAFFAILDPEEFLQRYAYR